MYRTKVLFSALLALAGVPLAHGQDASVPPSVDPASVTWEIARWEGGAIGFGFGSYGPLEPFDPLLDRAFERDYLQVSFAVSDPDFYPPDESGDVTEAADAIFYLFHNIGIDFTNALFTFTPPNAPPIVEDLRVFQPEDGDGLAPPPPANPNDPFANTFFFGDVPGAPRSDFPPIAFLIPEFNGKNQDRLQGFIDYDISYLFEFFVSNSQAPCTIDDLGFFTECTEPVSGFVATIFVLENPLLPPSNPIAFADAGADQLVAVNTPVTLDASRTFDAFNIGFNPNGPTVIEKDTLTYTWEWISGPAFVDPVQTAPSDPTATVEFTITGEYTFRVTVDDNFNAEPTTDTMVVTVLESLPPENAPIATIEGPANPVVVGATVVLDGSLSSDPDGDALTFRWVQTDELGRELAVEDFGESFQPLSGANTSKVTWKTVLDGTFYFRLLVSDGVFQSTARFAVTVNQPETAGVVLTASSSGDTISDDPEADDIGAPFLAPLCGAGLLPLAAGPLMLAMLRRRDAGCR